MSQKNSSVINKSLKFLIKKLKDKNLYSIYEKFERSFDLNDRFIVAVSGGPDSLSLAFLSKIYSLKKKINVKYVIIDHRLRSCSKKEAILTKKLLKDFHINAEILTWRGTKPGKSIQSKARNKRYSLLFSQCKKFNIKHILLGHHSDDLIENFLIRMIRGSGLRGLTSFSSNSISSDINILRPLMIFEKNQLVSFTNKIFKNYIKDPSNLDLKFKRIKIRNLLENLRLEGLDKKKFLLTIKNLRTSDETIKYYVKQNILKNCSLNKEKKLLILSSNFFKCPYEIIFRSFSECLREIGKNYYFPRGKKIDRILNDLKNKDNFKTTIGGCFIKKIQKTIIISREN